VKRVACWLVVLGLAGCATSAPLHYYTLSAVPPASNTTLPVGSPPVSLERLTIPPELDRAQLVRRLDATRLQLLDGHRWAAPLDDMMRRVLGEDLALRLGSNAVTNPNEPVGSAPRRILTIDIRELYGDENCAVTLHASWNLRSPDQPQAVSGDEQIQVPAGDCSGPAALPPGFNQALAQLSDRIVSSLLH
jgi:uncharacterized protein